MYKVTILCAFGICNGHQYFTRRVIVVIGVDISVHTFNHGQLYIVFSRMTSSNETIVYYYFDGNIIMQTNLSFLV